jgi:hypothetical protein
VADGCRLLTADNHETSEAALFIAQSDSPKAENTPLAYLRRLAHLEKARRLLAENQWEEVLQITDKVDGDGTFLSFAARVGQGNGSGNGTGADHAPRARYHAYRAGRLVKRLELVGFQNASARWREQQRRWGALAVRLAEESSTAPRDRHGG